MGGRICVTLSEKTADVLRSALARAEPLADVIEARMDAVEPAEMDAALNVLKSSKPVIVTYRPISQGGLAPDDPMERIKFWLSFIASDASDETRTWVDNEFDIRPAMQWMDAMTVIASIHDYQGVLDDLDPVYEALASNPGVIKIAVAVGDAADVIPLFKLLERARAVGRDLIPIALGEAGRWLRILGPAHGAFLTYSTLAARGDDATGQFNAEDMATLFRVKDITPDTAVYGTLAGDTSYSLSPFMQNAAFRDSRLDSVFVPFQVADLDAFIRRMVNPSTREVDLNLRGFAVTNPHKTAILEHLDSLDETAEQIGAVNTVTIDDDGKMHGHNTDAAGFLAPLEKVFGSTEGASVAVIGAGGAARACVYALAKAGSRVTVFARDPAKAEGIAKLGCEVRELDPTKPVEADIIVNATSVGTAGPHADESPLTAAQIEGARLVYDLVYNPRETALLKTAKDAGIRMLNGLEMLIEQGARQFELWTGINAPVDAMRKEVESRLE